MAAQRPSRSSPATLVEDLDATGASDPLHGAAGARACWLVATTWIPLLATAAGAALAGGVVVTGSVLTAVLTAVLGHVVIHLCVVLRGGEVPPHDRSDPRVPVGIDAV